jgi:hypothetical protein
MPWSMGLSRFSMTASMLPETHENDSAENTLARRPIVCSTISGDIPAAYPPPPVYWR